MMDKLFIILSTFFISVLALFILSLFFAKKRLEKKDLQIIELLKTINELRDKDKDLNKREAFRIDVPDEDCTFEFLDFEDKGLEVLKNRAGTGRIKDISATGLKLVCDYDLPLKKQIIVNIEFKLKDHTFSLKALLKRKEAYINNLNIFYGIEFIEMAPKQEERLLICLNNIETERRKELA